MTARALTDADVEAIADAVAARLRRRTTTAISVVADRERAAPVSELDQRRASAALARLGILPRGGTRGTKRPRDGR